MNWYKISQNVENLQVSKDLPLSIRYTLFLIKNLVDSINKSRHEKKQAILNLFSYDRALQEFRPGSYGFHSNINLKNIPRNLKILIELVHAKLPVLMSSLDNPHEFNSAISSISLRYDLLMENLK